MQFRKNQFGLASVEMVLLMPMILMLMYIMVHSAKTMVTFQKRIIESRNAAYTVELYSGGEVTALDELRQEADEFVKDAEDTIIAAMAEAAPLIEFLQSYAGIDVTSYIDNPAYLDILQKFPIQRYATVSEDSKWFYDSMLRITLDEMDDYSDGNLWPESHKDDPFIVHDPRTLGLYEILRNDYSRSGVTVGVSVSPFVGTLGKFHQFTGRFFMRDYHAADFSRKLDLHDITINTEEVIADDYNLKAGYSEEMKAMLDPQIIFKDLFAELSVEPLPTPGFFDITIPAPIDPTVGIVSGTQFTPGGPRDIHSQLYPGNDPDFDTWWRSGEALDARDIDYWAAYAESNNWEDPDTGQTLWPPNNGFVERPPLTRTIDPSENYVIDRYSTREPRLDNGSFFGRDGDDYDSRAMREEESEFGPDNPRRYRVIGPLEVTEGTAQAWFGKDGGGKQFQIVKGRNESIDDLTRPVNPSPPGRPAILEAL